LEDESELEESFSDITSESENEESSKEIEIADRAMEMQKKLNQTIKDIGANRTFKKLEPQSGPPLLKQRSSFRQQMTDFEQLLELIGTVPGAVKPHGQQLSIPEMDFTKIAPERIYERFADLGQYKIRRIEKGIDLGSLEVAKKGTNTR
jgi:hypothetical protein